MKHGRLKPKSPTLTLRHRGYYNILFQDKVRERVQFDRELQAFRLKDGTFAPLTAIETISARYDRGTWNCASEPAPWWVPMDRVYLAKRAA